MTTHNTINDRNTVIKRLVKSSLYICPHLGLEDHYLGCYKALNNTIINFNVIFGRLSKFKGLVNHNLPKSFSANIFSHLKDPLEMIVNAN